MATNQTNLSSYDSGKLPNGENMRIAIVYSSWNDNITHNLRDGALGVLNEAGVSLENTIIKEVPGSFELPLGAQYLLEKDASIDGVVCLGSVIQGETKHFDFVCQATASGIKDVSLKYNKPVIFGVLTDNILQQAIDRSGGKHGNKGIECTVACLKMIALKKNL